MLLPTVPRPPWFLPKLGGWSIGSVPALCAISSQLSWQKAGRNVRMRKCDLMSLCFHWNWGLANHVELEDAAPNLLDQQNIEDKAHNAGVPHAGEVHLGLLHQHHSPAKPQSVTRCCMNECGTVNHNKDMGCPHCISSWAESLFVEQIPTTLDAAVENAGEVPDI